ncbi:hypothetical protein TNCV_1858751 [Trichonephila clavipes]|nr:hypothetical protein TNCV_1858751 [Trichonephila clavipes]
MLQSGWNRTVDSAESLDKLVLSDELDRRDPAIFGDVCSSELNCALLGRDPVIKPTREMLKKMSTTSRKTCRVHYPVES